MRFDREGRPIPEGPTEPQRHHHLARLLHEVRVSRQAPPADDVEARVERARNAIRPTTAPDVRERAAEVRARLHGAGANPELAERTARARAALGLRDPAVEARTAAARAAIRGEHALRATRR